MKISIIGLGSMGSWFAENLAADHEISTFDTNKNIKLTGLKTHQMTDLSELKTFKPDLLINAVTLEHTSSLFRQIDKFLQKSCVITDIASVKGERLIEYYKNCPFSWVSLHPMFGPNFTNMRGLKNENVIIASESFQPLKKFFKFFFHTQGLNIFEIPLKRHDPLMSYSLVLPFTSSMVFTACLNDRGIIPGTTFNRHKEIAGKLFKEENRLLSEILFNSDSIPQIEKICSNLEYLKHMIKGKDYEETDKFLNKLREKLNTV